MPVPRLEAPDLSRWRAGNTGIEGVWRFDGGLPGRAVLVTALVHGNEVCGAWAVAAALEAGLRPLRGSLTLALCNLAAWPDRRCVAQDFNRLWGRMDWMADGSRSPEQARALELLPVFERADWLLDLHSMHDPGPPLVLTGLRDKNVALARRLGAPALVVADAGHAAGCRLRDHGRWDDPEDSDACALLVECGAHDEPSSRTVAIDQLGRFLLAAGTVDTVPAPWLQPLPPAQQVLQVTEAVTTREGPPPRLAEAWRTGQCIERAGTLLGWNGGEPFHTPYDRCTLIMPSARHAHPGLTIVRLAREASNA